MSHPELLLDNQLCLLVYRLDRAIQARYRPLLDALDITYPQYLVLMALWERERLTVGELCALLDLDTGTVSPLLKRMEKQGLVRRERSAEDERSVRVALTENGKALEERARAIPGEMASCLLGGQTDYATIKSLLQDLLGRLKP